MSDYAQYDQEGYMLVRGAIPPADLEPVRQHITRQIDEHARELLAEGQIAATYADEPFERRLALLYKERDIGLRSWDNIVFSRELYDLMTHPGILRTLEPILGPEITFHGDYHLRPKLPDSKLTAFPWHQDSQYYGEPTQHMEVVTVWIPLVDVDEANGCLYVIPGSQKWGLLKGERGADQNMRTFENVEARGTPVPFPMHKGDILLFHNLTFHASNINRTNMVRWSMDLRYSATPGTKPLTPLEQEAYDFMYGRLRRSGRRPVVVHTRGHRPTWAEWQAMHAA